MAKTCKNLAIEITNSTAKSFNDFRRNIDRKYALKSVFGYLRPEFGFKIEHYSGSNQIILKKNGKTLYNSDSEGRLASSNKFRIFFKNQVRTLLCRAEK